MLEVNVVDARDGKVCSNCKDERPRKVVEVVMGNGKGKQKVWLCKKCKDEMVNVMKKMRF